MARTELKRDVCVPLKDFWRPGTWPEPRHCVLQGGALVCPFMSVSWPAFCPHQERGAAHPLRHRVERAPPLIRSFEGFFADVVHFPAQIGELVSAPVPTIVCSKPSRCAGTWWISDLTNLQTALVLEPPPQCFLHIRIWAACCPTRLLRLPHRFAGAPDRAVSSCSKASKACCSQRNE